MIKNDFREKAELIYGGHGWQKKYAEERGKTRVTVNNWANNKSRIPAEEQEWLNKKYLKLYTEFMNKIVIGEEPDGYNKYVFYLKEPVFFCSITEKPQKAFRLDDNYYCLSSGVLLYNFFFFYKIGFKNDEEEKKVLSEIKFALDVNFLNKQKK